MDSATTLQTRLIGAILVEKNLITGEQLARAIEIQGETGERLGEIVVAEFGVSRLELASVLAEQWAELENAERGGGSGPAEMQPLVIEPLTPGGVQIRRPIGEIFVELGFISTEQLESALDKQRETGARIGEILVEQGSLTRLDLASALAEQWSALQKLRPPAPVADPTPWQNGPPIPPASVLPSSDDHDALAALEERVRIVERAAAATPWQDELHAATAELRASLDALEAQLATVAPQADTGELEAAVAALNARLDALEKGFDSSSIDGLRADLDAVKAHPASAEGIDELRNAVEVLEARAATTPELEAMAAEIERLAARLDGLASAGDLHERLEAVAEAAEATQGRVAGLTTRLDELARLEVRLNALAETLPAPAEIDDLRAAVAAVAATSAMDDGLDTRADITALTARIDDLAASVGDIAAATPESPDLAPRLDELAARVEEVAASVPTSGPDRLADRIVALEEEARLESGELERLDSELRELRQRTRERLEQLSAQVPDVSPVEELRARVAEIAGSAARADVVRALAGRMDELVATVPRLNDKAEMEWLRARVEDMSASIAQVDPELVESLRARIDEVVASTAREEAVAALEARIDELALVAGREPDLSVVDEVRGRVEELSATVARQAAVEELEARIAEVAAVAGREPDLGVVDEVRGRVEELSATVARQAAVEELEVRIAEVAALAGREPDLSPVDELSARFEELAAAVAGNESVDRIEGRLEQLEERIAEAGAATELREEMRRVAESSAAERQSLSEALFARVAEITESAPRIDELAELRARVDEVASRPIVDEGLPARVDELVRRLDGLEAFEVTATELREAIAGLDALRVADALAAGARFTGLEAAIESLQGVEERLLEASRQTVRAYEHELTERIGAAEQRLAATEGLGARIEELAADLARVPSHDSIAGIAAELRAEIEILASRPAIEDPSERLGDLSRRIDGVVHGSNERMEALADELRSQLAALGGDLGRRVDGLASEMAALLPRDEASAFLPRNEAAALLPRDEAAASFVRRDEAAASFVHRDEAAAATATHSEWVRGELDALAAATHVRIADLENRQADEEDAREGGHRDLDGRISGLAEAFGAARDDLVRDSRALGERLDATAAETAALRREVDDLRAAATERAGWEARIEQVLDERLGGLAEQMTTEVGALRADTDSATAAALAETHSLRSQLRELADLRKDDVETARAASIGLGEQVEALAALHAGDVEATQAVVAGLGERLSGLADSLHAEAAGARAAAESVASRLDDLHALRLDDLAAAELAGAELAARLDDHAVRSAAAALEVEHALREDLGSLAARVEEQDADGIEAREELRGEMERIASSVGWRLERIEESLSADDVVRLQESVSTIERRLEEQRAIGEEQVKMTERALRKGLASLGERLVDAQSTYAEAGNALRRSIERLGAAVVEADARMADQIPVSEADGCVAFAPTPAGYRLVEISGTPPEVGSTVELECSEGPLVVTRYGRSPLPLDGRPCAYLDRA